jgi:phage-related protein
MVRNPLSAKVTADVSDYISSLTAAGQRTESFGDTVSQAARQVDDLGDEATITAGKLGALSAGIGGTAAAVGLLSTALAPLALTLGGVAVAVGSVAAAFAGFIGAGVITHTEELTRAFNEARGGILTAIRPIGEAFGPILVDFVSRLDDLAAAVVDSIGPLAPFQRALRDVLDAVIELGPQVTAFVADLARDTLPVLREVAGFLVSESGPAFRDVRDSISEIMPDLREFVGQLIDLAPIVLEAGTNVASTLIPALSSVLPVIGDLLTTFNNLPDSVQQGISVFSALIAVGGPVLTTAGSIISSLSTLASTLGVSGAATGALSGVLGSLATLLTGPVGIAIGATIAALAAYETNFLGTQDVVNNILNNLRNLFRARFSEIREEIGEVTAALNRVAAVVMPHVRNIVSTVLPTVKTVFQSQLRIIGAVVEGTFDTILTVISASLSLLTGDVDEATGKIRRLFRRNFGRIEVIINNIVETFRAVGGLILSTVVPLYRKNINTLVDAIESVLFVDGTFFITHAFEQGFDAAARAIEGFADRAATAFTNVANRISEALSSNLDFDFPQPPSWLQAAADAIGGSLADAIGALANGNLRDLLTGGSTDTESGDQTSDSPTGGRGQPTPAGSTQDLLTSPDLGPPGGSQSEETVQRFNITVNTNGETNGRRIGRQIRSELRGRGVR